MKRPHLGRLAVLALAALAFAAWLQRPAIQRTWRRVAGPKPAPVIAVIPLESPGAGAAEAFFADGLTQELIARLGRTPGLTIVGRSGMSRLKGRALEGLAHDLNASAVLTGTVGRSGDAITMSLELIAMPDEAVFWSDELSGNITDIAALQTEAATEIAAVLRVGDTPASSDRGAPPRRVDARAYEMYLRGLDALARRRPVDTAGFFESAAAANPEAVEAHAGLVEALHMIDVEEGIPDAVARTSRKRAAAERAYQLDPNLPQANLAMGLAGRSLDQSVASLNRAIELDPSYAIALEALGDQLRDVDPERAIAFYGRALAADPLLETSRVNLATALLLLNRWGLTRGELLRARFEHAPEWSHGMFGLLDVAQGKYGDAFADLARVERLHDRPFFLAQYTATLATARKTAEALEAAKTLARRFPDSCEGQALLAGLLLDHGKASEARQLAQPLLALADGEEVRGSSLRCAATAAAALGDGARTAALLERILTREEWLRTWSFSRFGQSGRLALMGHLYPWTKVVGLPPVIAARELMDAAYARAHDAVAARLGRIAYQ